MRVKNNWKRPIRVGRQVIQKGKVEDVAEHLLLQPRIQRLKKAGKLIFPWVAEKPKPVVKAALKAPKPPMAPPTPADDLSALVHVGSSREKALNKVGVHTFKQVVEHAGELHKILDVPKSLAKEIVEDAESKVG